MRCRALSVRRSGSPGPQPIKRDAAGARFLGARELAFENAGRVGLCAAQDGAAERPLQQPLPEAAARAAIGNAVGDN